MNQALEFRQKLTDWFKANARDLPWRQTPTLYKTCVSEFMLQQTQVKTVIPYFLRWMKLFSDFEPLARATHEAVIQAWAGLGYYSRAKNLHTFAQAVVKKPVKTYTDLLKHKGIGSYTAAAIASLAFNEKVAVVDGNVVRVLSRIFNQNQPFKSKASALKWCAPIAQDLLDINEPGLYNEAIMELGALVCTKQNPLCQACPLKTLCKAFAASTVNLCPQFIAPSRKKAYKRRLWFIKNNRLLLEPSRVGNRALLELPEITEERYACLPKLTCIFTGKRSIGCTDYKEDVYQILEKQLDNVACRSLDVNTASAFYNTARFKSCQFVSVANLKTCALCGPHKRWISELLKKYHC